MTLATRTVKGNDSGYYLRHPNIVVMHATRSTIATKTDAEELESTLNWFTNPAGASAQWVLSELERVRVVADNLVAWHSAYLNGQAWGIELTQPTIDRPFTDGHYTNAILVGQHYVKLGVAPVWLDYWDGDVSASGFVGHEDTVQGRESGKSDPGPKFDRERFIAGLEDGMGFTTEQEKEIRRIVRNEVIDVFEFEAGWHGAVKPFTSQPHSLRWWIAELDEKKNAAIKHANDTVKHESSNESYTDAKARKAVKDAL